ncbi:hypothetical protein LIER_09622 [Lithospermum erythrorhizon]|uniref:Uncharacterized protein n=1 Tax=Lithospermum erythrorhizon TaxID=34254 RepID=A0AAV3PJ98_LITER
MDELYQHETITKQCTAIGIFDLFGKPFDVGLRSCEDKMNCHSFCDLSIQDSIHEVFRLLKEKGLEVVCRKRKIDQIKDSDVLKSHDLVLETTLAPKKRRRWGGPSWVIKGKGHTN